MSDYMTWFEIFKFDFDDFFRIKHPNCLVSWLKVSASQELTYD